MEDHGGSPRTINRRRALQAGIAGTAAAAVWTAPSILSLDQAFAGASCTRSDTLDWGAFTPSTALPSPLASFAAVGAYPALTITHPALGVTGTPNPVAGNDQVSTNATGGNSAPFPHYRIWMNCNSQGEGYTATFNFSQPVWNLRFSIFDIDRSTGNWQDVVSLAPTTFTNSPPAGYTYTGVGTAAMPWLGQTNVPATGAGSTNGTANITFAGPITTFSLTFLSGNQLGANQFIGLSNFRFCR